MSRETVLMYADTVRSPDMRYVIAHPVADPFLYVEHDGLRRVVVRSLEVQRMAEVPGLEPHPDEEFGLDQLRAAGLSQIETTRQVALNACRAFGVTGARVPPDFPLGLADFLRAEGIELEVDDESFTARRRVKTPTQVAGIRRAQRGAEAAVDAITALLAAAEIQGDAVMLDGEPLTSERLKAAAREAFTLAGVGSDDFIVAHGAQTCIGHHMGSGAIGVSEPITVDLWPRDEETGCFTDMTRTYCVGPVPEELATYHRLAKEALGRSVPGSGHAMFTAPPAMCSKRRATRRSEPSSRVRCSWMASSTVSATALVLRSMRRPSSARAMRCWWRETSWRLSPGATARALVAPASRTSFASRPTVARSSPITGMGSIPAARTELPAARFSGARRNGPRAGRARASWVVE
jgi:hypothetical protein